MTYSGRDLILSRSGWGRTDAPASATRKFIETIAPSPWVLGAIRSGERSPQWTTFEGPSRVDAWLSAASAAHSEAWLIIGNPGQHTAKQSLVAAMGPSAEPFLAGGQMPQPYAVYRTRGCVVAIWRLQTPMSSPGAKMFVDHWANLANGRALLDCIPLPDDFSPVQSGGSFLQMPDERATTRPALSYGAATARHVGGGLDPRAKQLEDVLAGLGFRGEVIDARPGPTITLYAFQPEAGAQESKIISREKDIQREMSAVSVRVAAIPGTRTIGIEISNANRATVLLTELLESRAYRSSPAKLALALGKTIGGEPVITDLARMPHLLLAGTTGSGKSVGLNVMILSLLYRMSPDQLRFIMIDPKELELAAYDGIPHLLRPIATDPGPAIAALEWAITEMGDRYKRMRGKVMGIADYQRDYPGDPMPYLVIVVDEVADLMAMADKKVIEGLIQRLAQKGRAAGIHLIIATQRPSVDVITGVIKANFPSRIAFQVVTGMDSKVILDTTGAEQLLGQGDALFMDCGRTPNRVHVSYTSMPEIQKAVSVVKEKWGEAQFEECESGEDAPVFDRSEMGEREPGGGAQRGDKIARATQWLLDRLYGQPPVPATKLIEDGEKANPPIVDKTMRRAANRLEEQGRLKKTNPNPNGEWEFGMSELWSLP